MSTLLAEFRFCSQQYWRKQDEESRRQLAKAALDLFNKLSSRIAELKALEEEIKLIEEEQKQLKNVMPTREQLSLVNTTGMVSSLERLYDRVIFSMSEWLTGMTSETGKEFEPAKRFIDQFSQVATTRAQIEPEKKIAIEIIFDSGNREKQAAAKQNQVLVDTAIEMRRAAQEKLGTLNVRELEAYLKPSIPSARKYLHELIKNLEEASVSLNNIRTSNDSRSVNNSIINVNDLLSSKRLSA